jgi:tRNA A37 N6-isopentenylltransferase MiaA
MKKKLLITLIVLGGLISAGYFGAGVILADDNNPHETLITRIAQKFNLNESDVEAVFQAVRDERQAEMKKQQEERLNDAINDGVITEAQKNAILTKMQEHQKVRGQNREEMQDWFEEQGIDQSRLRDYLGFGGHESRKGMGSGPEM